MRIYNVRIFGVSPFFKRRVVCTEQRDGQHSQLPLILVITPRMANSSRCWCTTPNTANWTAIYFVSCLRLCTAGTGFDRCVDLICGLFECSDEWLRVHCCSLSERSWLQSFCVPPQPSAEAGYRWPRVFCWLWWVENALELLAWNCHTRWDSRSGPKYLSR